MASSVRELLFICLLVSLWWIYLCFTTQPIVIFDAVGYQESGRLIQEKGFEAYLHQGLSREPLFPLLVAIAMWVGKQGHLVYYYPLRFMGFGFLILTMVLTHRLMLLLGINRLIAALGILYLGFSPTLLNSTLWLWSEFAAYPFVVLIVWWSIKSWKLLTRTAASQKEILLHGLLLAFWFIGLMCVKAVAEAVIFLYLLPFFIRYFVLLRKKDCRAKSWCIFVLTVLFVFEGFVQGYEGLNLQANGHYQFTNRGDYAFYSNTERRMEPLNFKRVEAAGLMVVDPLFCVRQLGYPDCAFWSARHSDDISDAKLIELKQKHFTDQEQTKYYIHKGIGMIWANPAQALLTMSIEAHKIFFWETFPNFVAFPDWIDPFISNAQLLFIFKLVIALICWLGFIMAIVTLIREKDIAYDQRVALWFIVSFIFWYAGVYSLFFIQDRYAFPIVSLMVVLIAFACRRWGRKIELSASIFWRLILCILLLVLIFMSPLIRHIKAQQEQVGEKVKFISIQYYTPYFPYLASIAGGMNSPEADLMNGYHFGTGYNFRTYFQMAANNFPNSDAAWALLGYCQYYQKDFNEALISYRKAYQLNPDFWWNDYNLAIMYFQQGHVKESMELLHKTLMLNQQTSLNYLSQNFFYRQIWQYFRDPSAVLSNNLQVGMENARLILETKNKERAVIKIF